MPCLGGGGSFSALRRVMFSNSTFSPAASAISWHTLLAAAVHVGGVELEVAEDGVGQVAEPREATHDADGAAIADQQVAQHGAALGLDDASDIARLDAGDDDVGEGGRLLGAELEEAVRRRAVDAKAGQPQVRRAVADREDSVEPRLPKSGDRPGRLALEEGAASFGAARDLVLARDLPGLDEERVLLVARRLDGDLALVEGDRSPLAGSNPIR